ncbi:uncharacterized protein [Dysidea avara]|uniref:uncharacterized protein n=1 Tax=Dysidea avara TaxID=196820 RepID=UPI0033336C53
MLVALLLIPYLPDIVEAVGGVIPGNETYSVWNNRNLSFRSLIDALTNLSNNTVVTLSNHAVLPSSVTLDHLNNITIIGQGNPTVNFNGTGALKFVTCNNVTIEGINWEKCGTSNTLSTNSGIEFHNSSNIFLKSCLLYNFTGQAVLLSKVSGTVHIYKCTFMYNSQYGGHGTAVYYLPWKQDEFVNKLVIQESNFTMNGQAQSVVYLDDCVNRCFVDVFLQDSVFINNQGVPIYISHNYLYLGGSAFHICGSVLFKGNRANAGGGIYSINSTILFCEGSNVQFIGNIAETNGGAICLRNSVVSFSSGSFIHFYNDDTKENGGAIHSFISDITFGDNQSVIFNNNEAKGNGGAICCESSSNITIDGNSRVTFYNNSAIGNGGAVYCQQLSHITFHGDSSVTFNYNEANWYGGAVYCQHLSHITFDGDSSVKFNNNEASLYGGAVYCRNSSHITFEGDSSVAFHNNEANQYGGAVYCQHLSHITFDGDSSVTFNNNEANQYGGAVYCQHLSHITFDGDSNITFNNNEASLYGGAVYCQYSSHIRFDDNSSVTFNNNEASVYGGAVHCQISSHITFLGNSSVTFNNNEVSGDGGAVYCQYSSYITFDGDSSVTFNNNTAGYVGGAVHCWISSHIIFDGDSSVIFNNNEASGDGGAVYCADSSHITFDGDSSVTFSDNEASDDGGGALYCTSSQITFNRSSKVTFSNNRVTTGGGAIYCSKYCGISFDGNTAVIFTNNIADNGGAVHIVQSSLTFAENSLVNFTNNTVRENGGAIHISDNFTAIFQDNSHIILFLNTADRSGGAIYAELTHGSQSTITFETTEINFLNNTALRGSNVYVDISTSCNDTCLQNSIVSTNNSSFINSLLRRYIDTPPKKLEFYNTATCVENDTNKNCQMYLTRNIMLGQEIIIDACVLDYYNQPVDGTLFIIDGEDGDHQLINGSSYVLVVTCEGFRGVRIVGEEVSDVVNYSITITSHDGSKSDLKTISLKLITELSPCHPGFHYDNNTCLCYSDGDILSCSGSTSSIKRGYWFGEVDDKVTVTVCPNNYCNFTCCETANGYYELSPMRTNQCNFKRSGTACGSCEDGYTLSFDSVECVSVSQCTTGQTALIVTLSIIYWIAIVVLVFIMTYYHVGIGYLYAITYYYSVMDILLSNILYTTQGLFTTVSIMSSIAKVTPQFLGQLCLLSLSFYLLSACQQEYLTGFQHL